MADVKQLAVQTYLEIVKNNVTSDLTKTILNLESLFSFLFGISEIEEEPSKILESVRSYFWQKYDLPSDNRLLTKEPHLSKYMAFQQEYASWLYRAVGILLSVILKPSRKYLLKTDGLE